MNAADENSDSSLLVNKVRKWFDKIRAQTNPSVVEVPIDSLKHWVSDNESGNIVHQSGRFFSVAGLTASTNYDNCEWEQPILIQPEIGILGIVTKIIEGHRWYLMQAKMEPGNINDIQLSPTVQATKSNYTRVHGGAAPNYLTYFLGEDKTHTLSDRTWAEQGGRFYAKKNRNTVVETQKNIDASGHYRWMTIEDIRALIRVDNIVNMDTRSVLSTMINEYRAIDNPVNKLSNIFKWCEMFELNNKMISKIVPLRSLHSWHKDEYVIKQNTANHFFQINAVNVNTGSREVQTWDQPMIKDTHTGLIGFLVCYINDTLHFLVQSRIEVGSTTAIDFGPTVQCSAYENRYESSCKSPNFIHYFIDNNRVVLYEANQSDEGGRFFQVQNRHAVVLLEHQLELDLHGNFIWMSYNQIVYFLQNSKFNVEARSLLACYITSKGGINESASLGLS